MSQGWTLDRSDPDPYRWDPRARVVGVVVGRIAHLDRAARVVTLARAAAFTVPESISLDALRSGQIVSVTYERQGDTVQVVTLTASGGLSLRPGRD
jgi:hypothetical protein